MQAPPQELRDIIVSTDVDPAHRLARYQREAAAAAPVIRTMIDPREVPREATARIAWAMDWTAAHARYQSDRIDPDGRDFAAPPLLTLARGYGDCEDLAMLLVAVLLAVDVPARLAWLEQPPPAPQNHTTAQAYAGGRWFWTEPSVAGALVGEHPYTAARRVGMQHVTAGGAP